jgi:energy-coupling factor transport system ATP-binding protein
MNIRLENVSFRYVSRHGGDAVVFSELSLDVPSGQCLGILGREGSGKSTLLQIIDGLLDPASGRVLLDGVDMTADRGRWTRARMEVGLGFQFPEHQFFSETVRDEFLFGLKERGVAEGDLMQRARSLLEEAGLEVDAILSRSPYTLSMGEARRVALAVLLAHGPRLLLVDEISAGLDAHGADTVLRMLSRALSGGSTIIAVSHDTDFLAEIAERVIILDGGRIAVDKGAGDVLSDAPLLAEYGYLPPETIGLAEDLRRRGAVLPRSLYRRRYLLEAVAALKESGA